MKLELDPTHAQAVQQAVARGVAETPAQYITQLIDRDQAEAKKHQAYVESEIDKGIASGFHDVGPNDAAELKAELRRRTGRASA